MRKAMKVAWVLVITSFALGSVWAGVAGARSNRWVEVWCDSDVTNGDGAAIDLLVVNGQTIAGADDRIGKILDASALDLGNKESATTAYNAKRRRHPGVVLRRAPVLGRHHRPGPTTVGPSFPARSTRCGGSGPRESSAALARRNAPRR